MKIFSLIEKEMSLFIIGVILLICFAYRGFRFVGLDEHEQWILPAYIYILLFSAINAAVLFLLQRKNKYCKNLMEKITLWSSKDSITAILFFGVTAAFLLGWLVNIMALAISFLAILPFFLIFLVLPFIGIIPWWRQNLTGNSSLVMRSCILFISIIVGCILFVVLTQLNLLPETENEIITRATHYEHTTSLYVTNRHPVDSMEDLCLMPGLLIIEAFFTSVLIGFYRVIRCLMKRKNINYLHKHKTISK